MRSSSMALSDEGNTVDKRSEKFFKFIEWLAPSFVFVAIICHAFDLYPIGPMFHLVGASLWVYVGLKKKAGPILLNFVPQIPVWISGLVYWWFG